MKILSWLVTTALAVAAAAWLLPGIRFDGVDGPFLEEVADKAVPALVVALIIGAVSLIVEPLVKLLSLPFIVLTLGLLLLVINALMLMLVGWLAGVLDLGFHVDGFWAALVGSVVITVVTWLLRLVLPDGE